MCITIAVSQIFKLFHAIKFDGQLHGLALRKEIKEPLVSTSQGYCSTNLLMQEVFQHIALFDAQLHGTLRDSSLRAPVQGDRRERCEARFPKLS